MNTILITGSTGAIGKQILKSFANTDDKLILLVRNPKKVMTQLSWANKTFLQRTTIIKGDLTNHHLGLSPKDYSTALTANVIIHSGGTMNIQLDDFTAKQMFAAGAESMIELAKSIHQKMGLKHFIHVVGYMSPFDEANSRTITEDPWQMKQFMKNGNSYERYKFLADLYVRQQASKIGFPLSVVNPSTVVGGQATGETEQIGGFGHLVGMTRRKLMLFIPGGKKYWLPMVSDVVLGDTIVYLAQMGNVRSKTYSFTPNKTESMNMIELSRLVSTQLQILKPRLTIPTSVIKIILTLGVGKLFNIPTGTIGFVSKKVFDNQATNQLIREMGISEIFNESLLPNIVSDLDYRLTYSDETEMLEFKREVSHQTIFFSKKGQGTPWVIVHGMFSNAMDLTSLANNIHEKTGNPVYIIDLPGVGHSPILPDSPTISNYVMQMEKIVKDIGSPINLIGHSLGANLAAKFSERNPNLVSKLVLLQPITHRIKTNWLIQKLTNFPIISSRVLAHMSQKKINQYLKKSGSFVNHEEDALMVYGQRMHSSLSSPRILMTNARLMRLIEHPSSEIQWHALPAKTVIVWGTEDKVYLPPKQKIYPISYLPYGHQFAIAEADKVSEIINTNLV